MRRSFEETIAILRAKGIIYDDESPRPPDSMPRYDDEDPCGFSVFRSGISELDLDNLDMRRTFFAKSEIADCSFKNSDLSESNLCWNDFISVDFTETNLAKSDLRSSIYEKVNFQKSDLSGADLRRSDFTNCEFDGAKMSGAKLTKKVASKLKLSPEQFSEIDWQDSDGEEPGGG